MPGARVNRPWATGVLPGKPASRAPGEAQGSGRRAGPVRRAGARASFVARRPRLALPEPRDSRGWRGLPRTRCQQPPAREEQLPPAASEASSVPPPSSSPPAFSRETERQGEEQKAAVSAPSLCRSTRRGTAGRPAGRQRLN